MISSVKIEPAINKHLDDLILGSGDSFIIPMIGGGSGYYIRGIEGLTPPAFSYSSARDNASHSHSFSRPRADLRQIIMTFGFDELYDSVYNLRTSLYGMMTTGRMVKLTFETTEGTYWIEGLVKMHESNVFSNDPLSQVTIECEDPFFKRIDPIEISETNLSSNNFQISVDYPGDVPTGFKVRWEGQNSTTRYVDSFRMRNRVSGRYLGEVSIRDLGEDNRTYPFLLDSSKPVSDITFLTSNNIPSTTRFLTDHLHRYTTHLIYPGGTNVLYFNLTLGSSSATNPGSGKLDIEVPVLKGGL